MSKLNTEVIFQPSRELDPQERQYHEEICEKFEDLYNFVNFRIPNGPAKGLFVERLTEAKMWANTALVSGPDEDEGDDN